MRRKGFFIHRRLYFILLLFFIGSQAISQEVAHINPADPQFRAKYETLSFDNKFVLLAESDPTNNYYIADFSTFSSKFEKVYFLSLVFTSRKIVNIDGDLNQDRIWFLSNKKFSEKETIQEFETLKEQTLKAASGMTEEAKAKWLSENDKYK
jgi:hypothetical protein